jgi:hypothetical protein
LEKNILNPKRKLPNKALSVLLVFAMLLALMPTITLPRKRRMLLPRFHGNTRRRAYRSALQRQYRDPDTVDDGQTQVAVTSIGANLFASKQASRAFPFLRASRQ